MNNELEPCPFCKSEVKLLNFDNRWDFVCMECNAHVHFCTDNREEAIAAWNKRVTEEKQ